MHRVRAGSLAVLGSIMLGGCVTVSDVTVAPFPCRVKIWPVPPADLIPREPQDGVCIRARLQQH